MAPFVATSYSFLFSTKITKLLKKTKIHSHFRMADIATNQHVSEIRHVNHNEESLTPSPVETPRLEVNPQPMQLMIRPCEALTIGSPLPTV